jgi:hypothetical protein
MKLITNNTSLNKNISTIINKYINYSYDHIIKNKSHQITNIEYTIDYSILDLIILSLRYGYDFFSRLIDRGFYMGKWIYDTFMKDLSYPKYIKYERKNFNHHLYIKNGSEQNCIDIHDLNVINKKYI